MEVRRDPRSLGFREGGGCWGAAGAVWGGGGAKGGGRCITIATAVDHVIVL